MSEFMTDFRPEFRPFFIILSADFIRVSKIVIYEDLTYSVNFE